MRIAYLILASGDYAHLRRLICALNEPDVHFFLHIDAKSSMPDNLGDLTHVTLVKREKVWWAGFSMIKATLNLIRAAVPGEFDRYVLLSGTHLPDPVEQPP